MLSSDLLFVGEFCFYFYILKESSLSLANLLRTLIFSIDSVWLASIESPAPSSASGISFSIEFVVFCCCCCCSSSSSFSSSSVSLYFSASLQSLNILAQSVNFFGPEIFSSNTRYCSKKLRLNVTRKNFLC